MEKTEQELSPSLQATLDTRLSLGELLQAHLSFAGDTIGSTPGVLIPQIANHLHVDPRTIHNWLKGRHRPHDNMIQDLSDTLSRLIPVSQDLEDRHQILEKQRRAIYAACRRRVSSPEAAEKSPETPKETEVSKPSSGFGVESLPCARGRGYEAKPEVKQSVLTYLMACLVLFCIGWVASRTGHASTDANSSGGNIHVGGSVVIGGFEEPAMPQGKGFLYFASTSTWKIWGRNGGGIQRNASGWGADPAPEGVQTAFLHSGDVHMSREIRLNPGVYNISLYASRRPFGRHIANPIQIFINGKEVSDLITPENTKFNRYQSRNFTVPASDVYTIEIATKSQESSVGDTFVDKVELNSISSEVDFDFLKNPFDTLGGKLRGWGTLR